MVIAKHPMPGAKLACSCPLTPMAMAGQTMGPCPFRLCWCLPGRMCPVAVDAYSKWPEVMEMSTSTASQTVTVLRKMSSANGLPEQLVTDNSPQIVSEEFASFCWANGIKHIRVQMSWPKGSCRPSMLRCGSQRRMEYQQDCCGNDIWTTFVPV